MAHYYDAVYASIVDYRSNALFLEKVDSIEQPTGRAGAPYRHAGFRGPAQFPAKSFPILSMILLSYDI